MTLFVNVRHERKNKIHLWQILCFYGVHSVTLHPNTQHKGDTQLLKFREDVEQKGKT